MDLVDFLKSAHENGVNLGDEIYGYFCQIDLDRVAVLKERIAEVRALKAAGQSKRAKQFRGAQSRHLGMLLERLMLQLLDGCRCFFVECNIQTTTAEVDYLIGIHPDACFLPLFQGIGTHAIGEAKCVDGGVKAEWINELGGLLPTHNARFGILFTAAPPKKVASHARNAIALHFAQGRKIVPFGFTQVQRVLDGENFLAVLSHQCVHAASHASALTV